MKNDTEKPVNRLEAARSYAVKAQDRGSVIQHITNNSRAILALCDHLERSEPNHAPSPGPWSILGHAVPREVWDAYGALERERDGLDDAQAAAAEREATLRRDLRAAEARLESCDRDRLEARHLLQQFYHCPSVGEVRAEVSRYLDRHLTHPDY